jgi:hypothetical protein
MKNLLSFAEFINESSKLNSLNEETFFKDAIKNSDLPNITEIEGEYHGYDLIIKALKAKPTEIFMVSSEEMEDDLIELFDEIDSEYNGMTPETKSIASDDFSMGEDLNHFTKSNVVRAEDNGMISYFFTAKSKFIK